MSSLDTSRTLLLMTNHHLGNFVVSLPFLDALSAACAKPADLVVDARHEALARLLPHAGNVIPYNQDHRRGKRFRQGVDFVKLVGRLASGRYRTVMDLGGGIQSVTLTTATFAPRRIGHDQSRRSWLYTERLEADPGPHATDRFTPFMRLMGLGKPGPLLLKPSDSASARLAELVPAAAVSKIAVIHGGAGYAFRKWPAERFTAVADVLIERYGLHVVFIGAPGEEAMLDAMMGQLKRRDGASRLTSTVDVVLALFDRASLLVSNESGPTHLAAATSVPIVTIFGPSKESKWAPYRKEKTTILRGCVCPPECRWGKCVTGLKCVMDVSVDTVLDAVEKLVTL
jgi:ADP-heptose:LPS heptosyltransferase